MRYQKLPEDFYEIIKRRKLRLDEVAIAIYLRGKSQRFGNPFWMTDKMIQAELCCSNYYIHKTIYRLQEKGVLKIERGKCERNPTVYTMLDSIMTLREPQKFTSRAPKVLGHSVKSFRAPIYTNKEQIKNKKDLVISNDQFLKRMKNDVRQMFSNITHT